MQIAFFAATAFRPSWSGLHDRYHAQAIAQHPRLTCNEQAAILWCANNPFLCGMGKGGYGNCLDSTGSPYAVPIRQVFGGKYWFLAVRDDQSIMAWGEIPDCFQKVTYPRGNLVGVLSTDEIFALVWDDRQVEVWDGRRRARPRTNQEPRCNWAAVTKIKANENAIAAILDIGGVIAYGRPLAGGTLPDLVNRDIAKRTAVDLYALSW